MTKPYFPPPGGEHAGYRQPGGRPQDDAPPPGEPQPRHVVVKRPDEPEIARAKAEYGTAPPPMPGSIAWLRPLIVMIAILIVGIQIALALRSVLRSPASAPRPAAARPAR
jgi:hypothetical protein